MTHRDGTVGENKKSHTPREDRDPDFAEEHQSITTDPDAGTESESPDGYGGMDPDPGFAV
ncbi:hypothetical protein ACFRAQ_15955 [Nocardia sp. NPDC056611]|uniref:hypothetical protein n=1 Tax=Nocardia sp. NPDC056611 TaxID=3345877 RepID=UPI00366AB9FF